MPESKKTVDESKLADVMQAFVGDAGGLIGALRQVQHQIGYLPKETVSAGAEVFNLSKAEVKGVISFYSDFRCEPKATTVVRLCAAEACQAVGGRNLQADLEKKYSLKMGETSASKDLTLEPVYCLGLCSCAPAAMVGDRLIGRADALRVAQVVENDIEGREK